MVNKYVLSFMWFALSACAIVGELTPEEERIIVERIRRAGCEDCDHRDHTAFVQCVQRATTEGCLRASLEIARASRCEACAAEYDAGPPDSDSDSE